MEEASNVSPASLAKIHLEGQSIGTVKVEDPRIDILREVRYIVERGATELGFSQYAATSLSTSSVQFNITTRDPSLAIDPLILIQHTYLLNAGASSWFFNGPFKYDGPRAYPMATNTTTLSFSINGQATTQATSDVIQPLLWMNNEVLNHIRTYSTTPSMMDQLQSYNDYFNVTGTGLYPQIYGANRSPFLPYGSSYNGADEPRAGFVGIQAANSSGGVVAWPTVSGTAGPQYILLTVTEPMYLMAPAASKFWSKGLFGVQTLQIQQTMSNVLSRVWSSAQNGVGTVATSLTTAPTVSIVNANAYLLYLGVDKYTQALPSSVIYSYYRINRYASQNTYPLTASVPVAVQQVSSGDLQLQSIPKLILVYVRPMNNQQIYTTADSYAVIQSISVTWAGKDNLFASASQQQLYMQCARNGLNMSWTQWSNAVGSVFVINCARDLPLDADQASSKLGTYQLLINANVYSTNSQAFTYQMFVVTVEDGLCDITGNSCYYKTGVLTTAQILEAHQSPAVDFQTLMEINAMHGSGFFGKFSNLVSSAIPYIKKALPYVGAIARQYAKSGGPHSDIANAVASTLGHGGTAYGGRKYRHKR